MDALAVETWRRVAHGDARGVRLREDTITETNLLDLDIWHPNLRVHRFNQNAEKGSGADWEWYIGSGQQWFALRVQAKRMDRDEYRQLQHPGDAGDSYQYQTLIRDSAASSMPAFPFYVFFNGWPAWPAGVRWHGCPRGRQLEKCIHVDPHELGCAAIPARLVQAIHRGRGIAGRRVAEYLPHSVPWSWLFGPGTRSPSRHEGSPSDVFGSASGASVNPRSWGKASGAPPNPTVLDALLWHRAIDAVARGIERGDLSLNDIGDLRFWNEAVRTFSRRSRLDPDPLQALTPLPAYASILIQARDEPIDDGLWAEFTSTAGPQRRTVIITELELGEDQAAFGELQ